MPFFPLPRLPLIPGALAFLLATLPLASAHHGQEFFLLYDARVQTPGHGILHGNFSFIDEGDDDSFDVSPSLSLGFLPRTAFNLRTTFTDEAGAGWAYQSIEPGFQFDITPPGLKLPVRFGLSVAYQFSESSGAGHTTHDLSGGTMTHIDTASSSSQTTAHAHPSDSTSVAAPHDHSSHVHPPAPPNSPDVDLGPDALTPEEIAAMQAEYDAAHPPAPAPAPVAKKPSSSPKKNNNSSPATHDHDTAEDHDHEAGGHDHSGDSIHNHDGNLLTFRFIFEADLTPGTLLVGNVINVLPESGSAAWGYGIGLRQRMRPGLSVGVEALGDFSADGYHEALGAVFWEPVHHVLLKVGAGTGLTSASPDATLRVGLLWMF